MTIIKSISKSQVEQQFCRCGCGEVVKPGNRFVNYHNRKGIVRTGKDSAHWKGGVKKSKEGYIYIYKPDHPYATSQGYVLEHRLVIEEYLGRYLEPDEISHHCNEVKNDNRIENLELTIRPQHASEHHNGRKRSAETKRKIKEGLAKRKDANVDY